MDTQVSASCQSLVAKNVILSFLMEKKKNQKLPYLLAHGHRLPNFTGKELRYIITLSAFSVGAGMLFSRPQTAGVTVFSLALAPGEITGLAHNT